MYGSDDMSEFMVSIPQGSDFNSADPCLHGNTSPTVSIPQGSDFNDFKGFIGKIGNEVSIPQGSDFNRDKTGRHPRS